jgi:hypothetical protein
MGAGSLWWSVTGVAWEGIGVRGEDWVISPMVVGREEMRELLERPYVGIAGAAVPSLLLPALEMTGNRGERVIYGSDCGVSCSCEGTLDAIHANVKSLLAFEGLTGEEKEAIGRHLEEHSLVLLKGEQRRWSVGPAASVWEDKHLLGKES